MTDKIRDRISKLLNMTVENGCSEDEAETALRMAMSAAARAGIDIDSLRPKDAPKRTATEKRHSAEMKPHQVFCARAAAELYGVQCNAWELGKYGVLFVGREELIELTEDTMFWLFRQVDELYKQALAKGLSKRERAEFRKTFKAACAVRVYERAAKMMREMQTNQATAQAATGHNALVVQGHFEQLADEQREYWDARHRKSDEAMKRRLESMSPAEREAYDKRQAEYAKATEKAAARAARRGSNGPRGRSVPHGSGTNAGYAAGDRVQLRKEVE